MGGADVVAKGRINQFFVRIGVHDDLWLLSRTDLINMRNQTVAVTVQVKNENVIKFYIRLSMGMSTLRRKVIIPSC